MTQLIPLSRPDIRDEDLVEVSDALRSGRLTLGPHVEQFERMVAARAGRPHGVAIGSASSAVAVSLRALGVGVGDDVLTPAFAFAGIAEAILHVGATPRFVDCDPGTLNMELGAVERAITPRTRCVVAEAVFGNPTGLHELAMLCARHEIPLLEDAGGGLGTRVGGEVAGRFGRLAVFSFYPNKPVTTGEGAVIVTHDNRLADLCRSLRNHGRPCHEAPRSMHSPGLGSSLHHERLGWSCRMSDLNAALGLAQLRRLDEIIHLRQSVADGYVRRLMDNSDIILPTIAADIRMAWSMWVIRLSSRFTELDRDEIIAGLRRHDIGASNYYPPVPLLPPFRTLLGHTPGDFPVAESAAQRTIALPFHNRLLEREQDLVCQTLDVMMQRVAFSR